MGETENQEKMGLSADHRQFERRSRLDRRGGKDSEK